MKRALPPSSHKALLPYLKRLEHYLAQSAVHLNLHQVAIGMSGGVDSSVTAYLLQALGLPCFGIFMRNWQETDENGHCSATQDYADVVKVAEQLNLDYYSLDLSAQYRTEVFERFLADYRQGLTPNPDVLCNLHIKFHHFWQQAQLLGATTLATGHYARLSSDSLFPLSKALDATKDQSYFLALAPRQALQCSLFPLGIFLKSEVREIAHLLGLATAAKKDSTGICFIGERDFQQFLSHYLKGQEGVFKSLEGQVVGQHAGAFLFTPGQRRGLNISRAPGPWYVVMKSNISSDVFVTNQEDHPWLFDQRVHILAEPTSTSCDEALPVLKELARKGNLAVKFRYRQADQAVADFQLSYPSAEVTLVRPAKAVAPGQYAVFYDGQGRCLTAGVIRGGVNPDREKFAAGSSF